MKQLFQLLDEDGNQEGLIESTLSPVAIEQEWEDFCKSFGADIEAFEDRLQSVHREHTSNRVFTIEINP